MPDGSLVPTPEESAESVMLELEAERDRVIKLVAKLRELGVEPD